MIECLKGFINSFLKQTTDTIIHHTHVKLKYQQKNKNEF
jgi:ribosomal protein S8